MSKGEIVVNPATLKAFRRKEHLSQAALAARATDILQAAGDTTAGLSESLIALVETGRRQPSRANAEAIAQALGVDVDAIATLQKAQVAS